MRGYQASFSSGELSPLLHGRVDLARYHTGLSELENMIVLPQGGVSRRCGFYGAGATLSGGNVKFIPFEYSSEDSCMLEFGDKSLRAWQVTGNGLYVRRTLSTPYSGDEVKSLRYVQSGNVIFLVHRNHAPMMLRRSSLSEWTLSELPYHDGPFVEGAMIYPGVTLRLSTYAVETFNSIAYHRQLSASQSGVFSEGMVGHEMQLEYTVPSRSSRYSYQSGRSTPLEVKGTLNITTSGKWIGRVYVYRNGVLVREYSRENIETQGQWDLTISETEDGVWYYVTVENAIKDDSGDKVEYTVLEDFNVGMKPLLREIDAVKHAINPNLHSVDYETIRKNSKDLYEGATYASSRGDENSSVEGFTKYGGMKPGYTYRYIEGLFTCVETGEVRSAVMGGGNMTGDIAISAKASAMADEYVVSMYGAQGMKTKTVIKSGNDTQYERVQVLLRASSFLKRETVKITSVKSSGTVEIELPSEPNRYENYEVKLWKFPAWSEDYGYPGAVGMYQDRLVFAGNKLQPQTLWLSRTGDYGDFSTSDPLRDDDAVTLTLAGTRGDRVHSLVTHGDLLAFTAGGEWIVKGSGDAGAITPTAITAREQTQIGTLDIQPITACGRVILVQAQGRKVYALGYDLNIDGYSGSELSVMSSHIFSGKKIISMAYQKEPDSLIWFVLDDGTAAVCTYNPEHEVTGWSRQSGRVMFQEVECIPGTKQTEIFMKCRLDGADVVLYGKPREQSTGYTDAGYAFESVMRTLRLSGNESGYADKKLIPRLTVYALNTDEAWASPKEWERRRRIRFGKEAGLRESEIELDNGFDSDACIQLRNAGDHALTVAAISPMMTEGG